VREHVDGPGAHEPVAVVVGEALRIAGERRRVARDVDDPRRADLSGSSRSASPTLPAKKAALPIEFSSAFSIAQATDSSLISMPQTVSACAAAVSPIVPMPQYRSYTVSVPESSATSSARV